MIATEMVSEDKQEKVMSVIFGEMKSIFNVIV